MNYITLPRSMPKNGTLIEDGHKWQVYLDGKWYSDENAVSLTVEANTDLQLRLKGPPFEPYTHKPTTFDFTVTLLDNSTKKFSKIPSFHCIKNAE